MRILVVGDCEANYLAKCHEAFRTGLRQICDTRMFGKGYPGYDPSLQSYQAIIAHKFPEAAPDIMIVSFDFAARGMQFPFRDLTEVQIPKAILLGDFWNVTETAKEHFLKDLEQYCIDMVMCYFPQPLTIFADTAFAKRFVHLLPSFDPDIFNDWREEKRYDVGFLAAGTTELADFYPERFAIHQKLLQRKNLKYLWAPHPGWHRRSGPAPLVGENFSRAINSCRIFITTSGKYKTPNPKYVEILASKSVLMAEEPMGADALRLQDGVNYVKITEADVLEKIDYYLARPDLCSQIAEAGYRTAMQHHTGNVRAQQFCEAASTIIADVRAIRNAPPRNAVMNHSAPTIRTSPAVLQRGESPVNTMEEVLQIPQSLLDDDNHPQQIVLHPTMTELPISSSPQYTLYRLIRNLKPKSILEIGSQIGASAVAMALAMRDNGTRPDIVCIDPFLPSGDNDGLPTLDRWYRNVMASGLADGIQLLMTTSERVLPDLKKKFDFILIDGSHEYTNVKYDFETSVSLSTAGSYIWCHDYVIYESVRRACDEVVTSHGLPFSVNRVQRNYRNELCGWIIARNLPHQFKSHNPHADIKLHLGCGIDYWKGYVNIDRDPAATIDLRMDFLDIDRAFPPGSVSEVVMIHSLNYFSLWDARDLIAKFFTLLKHGGKLIIETANVERLVAKIQQNVGKNFDEYLEGIRAFHAFGLDDMNARREYFPNKFSWTPWHLTLELQGAGFSEIQLQPPKTHGAWRDMRIEAVKGDPSSNFRLFSSDEEDHRMAIPTTRPVSQELTPAHSEIPRKGKLLVVLDPEMGHATVQLRGLIFEEEFKKHGWLVEFVDVRKVREDVIVQKAKAFDAVYLLKVAVLSLYQQLKTSTKAKIIFDLTDALWMPYHRDHGWQDLEKILKTCDALFSENEYICEYGRTFTSNVYSIPVCTQPDKFDAIRRRLPARKDTKIVVGWVGSTGTVQALAKIKAPLENLFRKYPQLELRIVGCNDPGRIPNFKHVRYTLVPQYNEDEMIREILGLDIGLFPPPLDIEDFAVRGALKALLYMTGGVPAVCQNAGDCAKVIMDGVTGMLANTPEEWEQKLDLLITSPELRARIGQNAAQAVRTEHTLSHVFRVLEESLLDVIGKPRGGNNIALTKGPSTSVPAQRDPEHLKASFAAPVVLTGWGDPEKGARKESGERIRVLIFYDEEGWAWWHRSHQVQKNISRDIQVDIKKIGTAFDVHSYDFVVLFDSYLLQFVSPVPPEKLIIGCSNERLLGKSLETAQQLGAAGCLVNNHLMYEKAKGLHNLYCCQNGVDTELFYPAKSPPNHLVACWVGNSDSLANKGLEIIEEACRRAGVELKRVNKNATKVASSELYTQERLRDTVYHRASFYICASEFEGTPNPALEAMACGLPVISTRVGNMPELIRDGYNGFLVDRTVESLVDAIERLKKSDVRELGRNGLDSITNGWTWKQQSEKYEGMFKDLYSKLRRIIEDVIANVIRLREVGARDEALSVAAAALKQHASSSRLVTLFAELLLDSGDRTRARSILLNAVERWPEDVDALNNLAVVEILEGNVNSAADRLRKILSLDSSNEIAIGNLKYLEEVVSAQRSSAGSTEDMTANAYEVALQLVHDGDIDKAVAALEEFLGSHPNHARAHNDLGALYFQRQENDRAALHLERALQLDPTNVIMLKNLAEFNTTLGDLKRALELYKRILDRDPNDVESLAAVGAICLSLNRRTDAAFFYARLLEVDPGNTQAMQQLQSIRQVSVRGESPGRDTEKVEPLRTQAFRFVEAGKLKEAKDVFIRITELQPESSDAFFNLGLCLHVQHEYDSAIDALIRAVELDPQNAVTAKNLAQVLIRTERFEEGIKLLAGILSYAPHDAEVIHALGNLYELAGRTQDAETFYRRVREIETANTESSIEGSGTMPGSGLPDIPASFCIITAGNRNDLLQVVIQSIHAQKIPEHEIIVSGNYHPEPGTTYVEAVDEAAAGRLGALRNRAVAMAQYENIVILDDDVFLDPDWYASLKAYRREFDILTSQVRLPDGGRYWDHATCGGPRGHIILNEDEHDDHLYMTGGGGWLMKRSVWQAVQWDEERGFYKGEDIDFSNRCRANGFTIRHNHKSIVYHADASYTLIGRQVFRRSQGRTHEWVLPALRNLSPEDFIEETKTHVKNQEFGEVADCLRFGVKKYPDQLVLRNDLNTLEEMFGGRLIGTQWIPEGFPDYCGALERYRSAISSSAPESIPLDNILQLSKDDQENRLHQSTRTRRKHPIGKIAETAHKEQKPCRVLWHAPVFNPSGYADEARNFVLSLESHGIPVALRSVGKNSTAFCNQLDVSTRKRLEQALGREVDDNFINVIHFPAYAFERIPQADYCIGRTMFETDSLPPDWVNACNKMDEIWVPSEFNMHSFRDAGVTSQLVKIPGGVDTKLFCSGHEPLAIPGARGVVFLSIFEWIYRKGWDVLLGAWARAFTADDNVSLVLRTFPVNSTDNKNSKRKIETRIDHFYQNAQVSRQRVAPIIVLGDQIPEKDLPRLFAAAHAYVAPSRGEGWGRPQMEAMACGLPVIATRWSGNLEFMNDQNSLLLDTEGVVTIDERAEIAFYRGQRWAEPSVDHLVSLLRLVVEQPQKVEQIGLRARQDMERLWDWEIVSEHVAKRLHEIELVCPKEKAAIGSHTQAPAAVCWEGSQFVNHSLALVNRSLCLELITAGHDLSIIPYEADQFTPAKHSPLQKIAERVHKPLERVDVHVRHHWPPNLTPPARGHWVVIQPWEFGSLPLKWVDVFSTQVDEMWVYTKYVRQVYIDSDVPADRVVVIPLGIDTQVFHPRVKKYKLRTEKKFKFLFIGGTIFRKGIDLLLEAYLGAFTKSDDVCLVIKDMGGDSFYKGQTFKEQIESTSRKADAPEFEYIDATLTDKQLAGLYTACDVLVHPYRGEGFGLPILEAMACGIPPVATKGGACLDFCHDGNSLLVKAQKKRYPEKKIGDLETVNFPWLYEVEVSDLIDKMRFAYHHPEEMKQLGAKASHEARERWTWERSAQKVGERISVLKTRPIRREAEQAKETSELPVTVTDPVEDAYLLGIATYEQRNYKEALQYLCVAERLLTEEPGDRSAVSLYDVAMRKGDCLLKSEDLQGAREEYERALNLEPTSSDACYNLGVCLELAGKDDAARQMYECALQLNPQSVEAKAKVATIVGRLAHASIAANAVSDSNIT